MTLGLGPIITASMGLPIPLMSILSMLPSGLCMELGTGPLGPMLIPGCMP